MPCHSYDPEESFNKNFTYADFLKLNQQIEENKKELDKTTRLLCATLRSIRYGDIYVELTKGLLEIEELEAWWNEHKAWDELRLIREEKKRKELERSEEHTSELQSH